MQDGQRELFRELKPICVSILADAAIKSNSVALTTKLGSLSSLLEARKQLLQGSLIAYAFFPLTQVLSLNSLDTLHTHPSILQQTLHAITVLLSVPGENSIEPDTLRQLWLVCVLVLGGPIENSLNGKGKAKAVTPLVWSDEVLSVAVKTLIVLIVKCHNDGATGKENLPAPILAHSLTSLLDLITAKTINIQLICLEALGSLLDLHFPDASSVQFFPGIVSNLSKAIIGRQAKKQINSALAKALLGQLATVCTRVIGDRACQNILSQRAHDASRVTKLEDLFKPDTSNSAPLQQDTESGPRSSAWLNATTHQLHRALQSILPALLAHDHLDVRLALATLSSKILQTCGETLQDDTLVMLLEILLRSSQDDWPLVASAASSALLVLSKTSDTETKLYDHCVGIQSRAMQALPQTIVTHGDDASYMQSQFRLLIGACKFLALRSKPLLLQHPERWTWALLEALRFARFPGLDDAQDSNVRQAWTRPMLSIQAIDAEQALASARTPFPLITFRHISADSTVRQLENAIEALMTTFSNSVDAQGDLIEHFSGLAFSSLPMSLRASALWILAHLVRGVNQVFLASKAKSALAELARQATTVLDYALSETAVSAPREEQLNTVERRRGFDSLVPLVANHDQFLTQVKINSAQNQQKSDSLAVLCMATRVLAVAADTLGSDFQSQFFQTLYILLAKMGASSYTLLREHAEVALTRIAFACNYASVANLILGNVDYILNAAAQRLLPNRLDPDAPEVLIVAIRIAGAPIIPYIQDIVDDVFDALDSYHGYDTLAARLLAVLDTLIKSLASSEAADLAPRARPRPIYAQPNAAADVVHLISWIQAGDLGLPRADNDLEDKEEAELNAPTPVDDEEEEPKATRPQAICAAIIGKATYFINHSSPFLRSRILSLFASAVPILGPTREADLLPAVNKAWPLIMKRLDPQEEAYVVAEAAGLVEQLALYVGDFICRKVLDDAWPLYRVLLQVYSKRDSEGALHGQTTFTVPNRIYLAVLNSMTFVVGDVPLRDGVEWSIAMGLRPFLSETSDSRIRQAAVRFFNALQEEKPECVWIQLRSTEGWLETMKCLRLSEGDFTDSTALLFGE